MGASFSYNKVDDVSNEIFNTLNSITQNCTQSATNNQNTRIKILKGNFVGNTVNSAQQVSFNPKCMEKSSTLTSLDQELKKTVQQQAKAVVGAYGIGISASANITNDISNLASTMRNEYVGKCIQNVTQQSNFNLTLDDGSVVGNVFNFNQALKSVQSCTLQQSDVISAIQKLKDDVKQSASSDTKGINDILSALLGPLKWIIIAVVVVVAVVILIFIIKGGKITSKGVEIPQNQPNKENKENQPNKETSDKKENSQDNEQTNKEENPTEKK